MTDIIKRYFLDKMDMEVEKVENLSRFKNRVYKIQAGNRYFILKIFPKDETSARRSSTEAEIYRFYSSRCELLPHMYFEDFTCQIIDSPVICREYRCGIDLRESAINELRKGNEDKFRQLIENSIAAANCFHGLETSDSFGSLSSSYSGSYLEFLLHEKNSWFGLTYEHLYNSMREIDDGALLTNYLKGNNLITPQRFTLCHNDFRGHEILVNEDGTINSIIDWERAIIGDPLCDFGSHLFSLLNAVYDDITYQEKIIHIFLESLPKELHAQSISFYLAERAILTSIIYYFEYNSQKFEWAMRFAGNMLSNNVQNADTLIELIQV